MQIHSLQMKITPKIKGYCGFQLTFTNFVWNSLNRTQMCTMYILSTRVIIYSLKTITHFAQTTWNFVRKWLRCQTRSIDKFFIQTQHNQMLRLSSCLTSINFVFTLMYVCRCAVHIFIE